MTEPTFSAADYLEIRRRGVALHTKISKKLTTEDIKICAKHLGVWHQKSLVLDDDNEMDLFTDYSIYGYRPHGFNMAEKFLRLFHKEADDFELEMLVSWLFKNTLSSIANYQSLSQVASMFRYNSTLVLIKINLER